MGIGVGAETHADGLKIFDQGAGRKVGGAVEHHMFKKMGQAALRFRLGE
ncbi:hypothetical protein BMS3Abin13_01966 [bacterium BMS3Abin13]|nr:hypothetical protein BMS3Abin13_01966 [bacterium BMS3Abin13]